MKKVIVLAATLLLSAIGISFSAEGNLLVDDFEIAVSGGPNGTVDFGAGNDSPT